MMKKTLTILILCVAVFTANAQVFTEYFENYTVGSPLEGDKVENEWHLSGHGSNQGGASPVIEEGPWLQYQGYPGSFVGNMARLNSIIGDDGGSRLSVKQVMIEGDSLKFQEGEKVYTAFLVSIGTESKTGAFRDFFTYEGSETSIFNRGRVFAKYNKPVDPDTGEPTGLETVEFAITKNSTSGVDMQIYPTDIPFVPGETYLLVVVYERKPDAGTDVVHLCVNPDLSKPYAEQVFVTTTDGQSDYGSQGVKINLRQRGMDARVAGIRVGSSWEAVMTDVANSLGKELNTPAQAVYSNGKTIYTSGSGVVEVINLSGVSVYNGATNGTLTPAGLNKGLYLVKFTSETGKVSVAKVILN